MSTIKPDIVKVPRRRVGWLAALCFILAALAVLAYPASYHMRPRVAVSTAGNLAVLNDGGAVAIRFDAPPEQPADLRPLADAGLKSVAGAAWWPARARDAAAGVTATFVPLWMPGVGFAVLGLALRRRPKAAPHPDVVPA